MTSIKHTKTKNGPAITVGSVLQVLETEFDKEEERIREDYQAYGPTDHLPATHVAARASLNEHLKTRDAVIARVRKIGGILDKHYSDTD